MTDKSMKASDSRALRAARARKRLVAVERTSPTYRAQRRPADTSRGLDVLLDWIYQLEGMAVVA
jgi:hypothetical protein